MESVKKHVALILKAKSKTRWSAMLESVQVIYKHLNKVLDALEELQANELSSSETKSETISLMWNLKTFEFVLIICFWYGILKKIDRVNKLLQKENA